LIADPSSVREAMFRSGGRGGTRDRVLDGTTQGVDFGAFHGPTARRKQALFSQWLVKDQCTVDAEDNRMVGGGGQEEQNQQLIPDKIHKSCGREIVRTSS
jgi:hypothetical protein